MNHPTRIALIAASVVAAVSAFGILAYSANGRSSGNDSVASIRQNDLVERGKYIVHGIGLCVDCHSPRNERGEFLENRHLTGAPLPFKPVVNMPWMPAAPPLAGLPAGYTMEDLVNFLMTGRRPHGLPPVLPPMPPYRMNREDAEAAAAYIRSLPAGAGSQNHQ